MNYVQVSQISPMFSFQSPHVFRYTVHLPEGKVLVSKLLDVFAVKVSKLLTDCVLDFWFHRLACHYKIGQVGYFTQLARNVLLVCFVYPGRTLSARQL